MIELRAFRGAAISPHLAEVARLRIRVFREYPYLYDGTEDYESDYLKSYVRSKAAVVVVAMDSGRVIGASTGLPLTEADGAFAEPFGKSGLDTREIFYFGESVLEPGYRGQGIGHRFFDARESHARGLGFKQVAFCSVIRSDDHPLKPTGYRDHTAFWTKRGFQKHDELMASLPWKQIDQPDEVENRLVFWLKEFQKQPASNL